MTLFAAVVLIAVTACVVAFTVKMWIDTGRGIAEMREVLLELGYEPD